MTLPVVRWAGELLRGSASGGILLLTAARRVHPGRAAVGDHAAGGEAAAGRRRPHRAGWSAACRASARSARITATLGTGFVLVAALPSSVILLSLAVLLAAAGIGLYVYLRRVDRAAVALGGRGQTVLGLALIGLAGAGLTVLAPNPCDVETAYHCASVETDDIRPGGRLLMLNSARHSYVDLDDSRHLEFAYAKWMGAVADMLAPGGQPIRTLHIGGGGFTMPRYVDGYPAGLVQPGAGTRRRTRRARPGPSSASPPARCWTSWSTTPAPRWPGSPPATSTW